MKKIAYLLAHNINSNDGVTKKIEIQVNAWRAMGVSVRIFCIVPEYGNSDLLAHQYKSKGALGQRLRLSSDLIDDVLAFNPEVIYYRYDTWSATLNKLAKNISIIAELNTNDLGEAKLLLKEDKSVKSILRFGAFYLLRGFLIRSLSGIVGVTAEIVNLPANAKYHVKSVCLPNSIDLAKYRPEKVLGCTEEERISLFFMGTPNQAWHGTDIIEKMAHRLPQFDFHLVGMDGNNTNNCYYHGYLSQIEYLKILKKCHICIGTLALHGKNLNEASPLKVREYLAYGFPVILGYQDTAFLEGEQPDWVHVVGKNIDYDKLVDFIYAKSRYVVSHNELSCISSALIEEKRLKFMQACYKQSDTKK